MNQMVALGGVDPTGLPNGTRLLNGMYEILDPLQQGGFAMTYVARDSLERHVVIKECFPAGMCERVDGKVKALEPKFEAQFAALKQQFLREALGVAGLKHPYIVAVHQVFEENNTAYMSLDYVEGIDLISVLEDEPARLTPDFLDMTLRESLKAVRHIHANGILHRDIAPDNIRVDRADRITLIDFGAAGERLAAPELANALLPAVKDGYSPPEFYKAGEVHDFSSDLYSLGATFYHLITGDIPPDGNSRKKAIASGEKDPYVPLATGDWACGYHLLATIDLALEIDRTRRPQTTELWLKALDDTPKVRPAPPKVYVFDPELDAVVSRLVADTNQKLAAIGPGQFGRPDMTRAAPLSEAPAPKKWVDILGNPIIDLGAWLSDQDPGAAQAAQPAPPAAPEAQMPQAAAPAQPAAPPVAIDPVLARHGLPQLEPAAAAQPPAPPRKRRSLLSSLLSRVLPRNPETLSA